MASFRSFLFGLLFVAAFAAGVSATASDVARLSDAETVLTSPSVWAVYYPRLADPKLNSVMEVVATMSKGTHSVGALDESSTANIPPSWGEAAAASSSTVLIFQGDDKQKPMRSVQIKPGDTDQQLFNSILQAMTEAMEHTFLHRATNMDYHQQNKQQQRSSSSSKKASAVVSINGSNFEELVLKNPAVVAVAFAAPWCGHCKKLEPEWREAAEILAKDDVMFGWVDATVETDLARTYQVQGYPTIKIFPGGAKTSAPYDYPAERSAGALVEFMLEEVERSGVPKPVPELTEPSQLEEACSGSNHLCVLAALPHILDTGAAGRENYLQSLSKVARTFRKNFSFLWFEGGSGQGDLEQALGLTFGFPAIVAVSLDRKALAVMHGAFRDTNVQTFLHGITTGRQPVVPLANPVLPVSTTTPWDGKDAQPIQEEDDFDLDAFLNDEM